jgi:hypothetical protein
MNSLLHIMSGWLREIRGNFDPDSSVVSMRLEISLVVEAIRL